MKIGVLALQGDFAEHQVMLEKLGAEVVQVRVADHLAGLSGLIIPGGESTTIGKLAVAYDLVEPLREFSKNSGHLGYLRRRDLFIQGYPSQPTFAAGDGY